MSKLTTQTETIAAIATAISIGRGGIAVIRISGPKAIVIAKKVLYISGNPKWESHRILYGHVMDKENKEYLDEVLILVMHAPNTFTGEEVVEVQCHGGVITVNRVLERILDNEDIRHAHPGEFSQQAVLNNKLNLTQAESINDLIAARSKKAAQLAIAGLDGGIQRKMSLIRNSLLNQLSEIEARIDFEDELPKLDLNQLTKELNQIKLNLEKLVSDANLANCIRQGVKIAIIGRPNVGKSSLLNRLCREDKAIVTEIPGTTRDSLECDALFNNVPVTLIDSAGIRETKDKIENIGIKRSHDLLLSADIIILLFDLTVGWEAEDQLLVDSIPNKTPSLIVGNKMDIIDIETQKRISQSITYLPLSAITGQGEDELINHILNKCGAAETNGLILALNERQKDLASKAIKALKNTEEVASQKLPWDFWTIDLRQAIHYLGEITGEEITEALLDRIFSRFCIGK